MKTCEVKIGIEFIEAENEDESGSFRLVLFNGDNVVCDVDLTEAEMSDISLNFDLSVNTITSE